MRWRLYLCTLFLACLTLPCTAQAAEKRVALIIGNSQYRSVPRLDNPANDARLIATTLQGLGFTMVGGGAQLDLDHDQFVEALRKFRASLSGGSIGVFYYAGHGLQVDGVNYLVPVDANPTKPSDVDDEMIDANRVLRKMQDAGTSLNIVMLDACRNNPFRGPALRATSNGLVEMQALEGTLISFATSPGTVADDGDAGTNGPYAVALAEALPKPGLDVFQTFNEVNKLVYRHTGRRQQPWMSSSPIEGEFYFAGQQSPAIPSAPAPMVADEPKAPPPAQPAFALRPAVAPAASPAPLPVTAVAVASPPPAAIPAPVVPPPTPSPAVTPPPTAPPVAVAVVSPQQPAPPATNPARADTSKATMAAVTPPASTPAAPSPPAVPKAGDVLVATAQSPAPAGSTAADARALDAAAWDAIKSSSNQADFQAYLNKFPNGDYAGNARIRIDNLQAVADDSAAQAAAKQLAEEGTLYHGCWDPYQKKNYSDAMPACHKAADHGDVIAMRVIGALYDDGLGVARDRTEAARWYRMAADKGDADAANDLGVLYANGAGVTRDYAEALRWMRQAADKGNIASAMHNVGYFYDNGWGVTRDYAEALRWYRMAADKGNVPAMNDLGALYGNGHGVPIDYAEALRWYRLAADQGNVNAMNNLGALYASGQGVTRDYAEALRWFRMAADKGNAVALRNLGDLYASGQGVPQDFNQARIWYQKAIDLGDNEARNHLKNIAARS